MFESQALAELTRRMMCGEGILRKNGFDSQVLILLVSAEDIVLDTGLVHKTWDRHTHTPERMLKLTVALDTK